jgi:hypothetical protein
MTLQRIFEGFVITFTSSSLFASLLILILILIRIRPLAFNVPIILTCNTYIALIGSSFMTLLILILAIKDDRDTSITAQDSYCQIRSYVNYTFICAFYYSCVLQASFRLCRVVFPQRKVLQSRGMCWLVIIAQWTLASVYILVYLLLADFEYQPEIHSCWLSFTNIRALCIAMAFVYGVPLLIMALIYSRLIRYIRQTAHMQQSRQSSNKRDVLVVKRIIILVLIAMGIGIPTGCLLIVYIISGYKTSLSYHIQALSLTMGLVVESVALAYMTPQVREIWAKNRQRIDPVATITHAR